MECDAILTTNYNNNRLFYIGNSQWSKDYKNAKEMRRIDANRLCNKWKHWDVGVLYTSDLEDYEFVQSLIN